MPTRTDKMILFVADQVRMMEQEIQAIPQGSPSYKVMSRMIASVRDLLEIIKSVIPEPGE